MNSLLSAELCANRSHRSDDLILNLIDAPVQNNVLPSIGNSRNHTGQISGSARDVNVLLAIVLLVLRSYICRWQIFVLENSVESIFARQ